MLSMDILIFICGGVSGSIVTFFVFVFYGSTVARTVLKSIDGEHLREVSRVKKEIQSEKFRQAAQPPRI
jgi:hypothetical protein